jgi:hypothetical protein
MAPAPATQEWRRDGKEGASGSEVEERRSSGPGCETKGPRDRESRSSPRRGSRGDRAENPPAREGQCSGQGSRDAAGWTRGTHDERPGHAVRLAPSRPEDEGHQEGDQEGEDQAGGIDHQVGVHRVSGDGEELRIEGGLDQVARRRANYQIGHEIERRIERQAGVDAKTGGRGAIDWPSPRAEGAPIGLERRPGQRVRSVTRRSRARVRPATRTERVSAEVPHR